MLALTSCNKEKTEDKEPIQKGFVISNEMMKNTTVVDVQDDYVEDEMSFFGKISADKNQYIDIYPLVGGNVMSVNVELGDYVHAGQIMATIRSTELAGFQKDLSDARNEVAVAENNLRVAQDLYAGNSIPKKMF
jgi:cobalt-zinc-cadmium efflux system membrane fusion protein